jgi:hypothetical protein
MITVLHSIHIRRVHVRLVLGARDHVQCMLKHKPLNSVSPPLLGLPVTYEHLDCVAAQPAAPLSARLHIVLGINVTQPLTSGVL